MKLKKALPVIIIIAVIALGVAAFFARGYIRSDISGSRGDFYEYTLVIEPEDFEYQVGAKLAYGDIIKNDTLWCYWMERHYPDFTFINGEYELNSTMSYEEIAKKLQEPDVSHKTVSVVIPEGYNVFDIADTMEENGICSREDFLEACRSKKDYAEHYDFLSTVPDNDKIAYQLEGFLFPATYDIGENTPAYEVVEEMLDAFDNRIAESWSDFCKQNGMSLFELVTLASIVEKETLGTGIAENIASVFLNRLEIKQQLQSDVTIEYGNALRANGFDDGTVFSYNTYKCAALPSGPVCNPGIANIEAVINHNDTKYFYFFSDLEKKFHFAETYDEFEKLKSKYPWQ